MFDEQECEKALENLRVLERKDNFKKWGGQVAPQINCDVVERLIKDHFESKENTLEFNSFKLYANGTLKNMSKDELINYIHVLHHNWGVSDEQLFNVFKINNKLQDELDVIKNPHPYKFEDLKVGMFVYDICLDFIYRINKIYKNKDIDLLIETGFGYVQTLTIHFEEGRFFPVTKALEYQK